MAAAGPVGVASAGYRWYLGAQVLLLIAPGLAILACAAALTARATPKGAAAKDATGEAQEPESTTDTATRSGEKGTSA